MIKLVFETKVQAGRSPFRRESTKFSQNYRTIKSFRARLKSWLISQRFTGVLQTSSWHTSRLADSWQELGWLGMSENLGE